MEIIQNLMMRRKEKGKEKSLQVSQNHLRKQFLKMNTESDSEEANWEWERVAEKKQMKRVTFLLEETDLDQVEDYLMKNKWKLCCINLLNRKIKLMILVKCSFISW